jgi:hypothetical protein
MYPHVRPCAAAGLRWPASAPVLALQSRARSGTDVDLISLTQLCGLTRTASNRPTSPVSQGNS